MATEKRLIDANELVDTICRSDEVLHSNEWQTDEIVDQIERIPTVDAVEVVHGYWDDSGRYQFPSGKKAIRCNICGCALSEGEYHLFNWNYCPVCGAKMDGERRTDA